MIILFSRLKTNCPLESAGRRPDPRVPFFFPSSHSGLQEKLVNSIPGPQSGMRLATSGTTSQTSVWYISLCVCFSGQQNTVSDDERLRVSHLRVILILYSNALPVITSSSGYYCCRYRHFK